MFGALLGGIVQAASTATKGAGEAIAMGGNNKGVFGLVGNSLIGLSESMDGLASGINHSDVAGVAAPSAGIMDRARGFFGFGSGGEVQVAAAEVPQKLGRSAHLYNNEPTPVTTDQAYHADITTIVAPSTPNFKQGSGMSAAV